MKKIKLFLLTAAAVLFAACSEDDLNSNAVQVGFEGAQIQFNESDGLVHFPLKVVGERNGDIKVKIGVTSGTAVENEHFIITSYDINIPADADEVCVEMRIIDDGQTENDDRTFTISVVDIQGAELSQDATCTVVLKDVDANPFFKLFGKYEAEAFDVKSGDPCNFIVTIDDDGDGDGKYLYASGCPSFWYGFDTKIILGYNPDGTLNVEYGYWDGLYNFGSYTGVVCYQPGFLTEGKIRPVEEASATYNSTFDTITFEDGLLFTTGVYVYDNGNITDYKGYYDAPVYVTKLTKVNE